MSSTPPTRLPNGVGNVYPKHLLGGAGRDGYGFGLPDPLSWHVLSDDFNTYNTALWTLSGTGTPAAAILNTPGGGIIELTTTTGGSDSAILQTANALVSATAGQQLYFRISFQLTDATNCTFMAGLVNQSLTGLSPTDGIYFTKANASTNVLLNFAASSTVTTNSTTPVAALSNSTFVDIGFFYDGVSTITACAGPTGQPVAVCNLQNITTGATIFAPTFGIINGAAAAKKLDVNFAFFARQRPTLPVA